MEIKFEIHLTSDGEPGSGLGTKTIDELVPRDGRNRPIIHASHIKGLLRDSLKSIEKQRRWTNRSFVERLFGKPDSRTPESDALVYVMPAVAHGTDSVRTVTRTAISTHGVGKDQSLRTTESISHGSVFRGNIRVNFTAGGVEDVALRLALLNIHGIGGNRNRGSGRVKIVIEDENRSPGDLLRTLDSLCQAIPDVTGDLQSMPRTRRELSTNICAVELFFIAETPICCPEITDKTNVIATGFSIPASAVQGALLTRINRENSNLADALFENRFFRCWPMHPCSTVNSKPGQAELDSLPYSTRVGVSNRSSKYVRKGSKYTADNFWDTVVDRGQAPATVDGAPWKGCDGVLLQNDADEVSLWKASNMPRVLTAHGVKFDPELGGKRNLFVVEAMAPMIWRGMALLPEDAAKEVIASLERNPHQSIGKGRTVRGNGILRARVVPLNSVRSVAANPSSKAFIVQSPIDLTDPMKGSADELMKLWASKSFGVDPNQIHSNAKTGILFGWNRLIGSGRQGAIRVLLPGSVVRFETDTPSLLDAYTSGEFEQLTRQRGCGT